MEGDDFDEYENVIDALNDNGFDDQIGMVDIINTFDLLELIKNFDNLKFGNKKKKIKFEKSESAHINNQTNSKSYKLMKFLADLCYDQFKKIENEESEFVHKNFSTLSFNLLLESLKLYIKLSDDHMQIFRILYTIYEITSEKFLSEHLLNLYQSLFQFIDGHLKDLQLKYLKAESSKQENRNILDAILNEQINTCKIYFNMLFTFIQSQSCSLDPDSETFNFNHKQKNLIFYELRKIKQNLNNVIEFSCIRIATTIQNTTSRNNQRLINDLKFCVKILDLIELILIFSEKLNNMIIMNYNGKDSVPTEQEINLKIESLTKENLIYETLILNKFINFSESFSETKNEYKHWLISQTLFLFNILISLPVHRTNIKEELTDAANLKSNLNLKYFLREDFIDLFINLDLIYWESLNKLFSLNSPTLNQNDELFKEFYANSLANLMFIENSVALFVKIKIQSKETISIDFLNKTTKLLLNHFKQTSQILNCNLIAKDTYINKFVCSEKTLFELYNDLMKQFSLKDLMQFQENFYNITFMGFRNYAKFLEKKSKFINAYLGRFEVIIENFVRTLFENNNNQKAIDYLTKLVEFLKTPQCNLFSKQNDLVKLTKKVLKLCDNFLENSEKFIQLYNH